MSQTELRAPTAETEDVIRDMLEEHLPTLIAEAENTRRLEEAAAAAAAAGAEAKAAGSEMESAIDELIEQLEAAEARATLAEQQAIYAGQQAAQAAEQLMQAAQTQPQSAGAEVPGLGWSFTTTWGGWCAAVLAVALAAGAYVSSYRPLREQLTAQTKLTELQARRSRETEATLRRSFDRERETFTEELGAARALLAAATPLENPAEPDAPSSDELAATDGDSAAAAKATRLEARAAKREARLEKKAERAARAAGRKKRGASSGDADENGKAKASEPKLKAKSTTPDTSDELGSDDPLEGL